MLSSRNAASLNLFRRYRGAFVNEIRRTISLFSCTATIKVRWRKNSIKKKKKKRKKENRSCFRWEELGFLLGTSRLWKWNRAYLFRRRVDTTRREKFVTRVSDSFIWRYVSHSSAVLFSRAQLRSWTDIDKPSAIETSETRRRDICVQRQYYRHDLRKYLPFYILIEILIKI